MLVVVDLIVRQMQAVHKHKQPPDIMLLNPRQILAMTGERWKIA
jgi:hypothetical protein